MEMERGPRGEKKRCRDKGGVAEYTAWRQMEANGVGGRVPAGNEGWGDPGGERVNKSDHVLKHHNKAYFVC